MKFSEANLVEDYIIKQLQDKGWKFVPADELKREGYEEPLLVPNVIRALERINKKLNIGDEEINKVLNELKLTGSGPEGSKKILNFYKFGVPVKLEKERIVEKVQLFDYDDVENNECIISRQVIYTGRDKIRIDIVLYINGIPLVNIECKNPADLGVSWIDAYKQIKDNYEKAVPELYKYVQLGVAAESIARYFPIVPWQDTVLTSEWREGLLDSIDSVIEMLNPSTLLDLIKNFIFFRIELGNATKVIGRYMQIRAANKTVDRVLKNLHYKKEIASPSARNDQEEAEKNKGLIWHWQGSGKTLTMIFACHKLFYAHELENPTIFFIVDRIELENQLYEEFNSLKTLEPEIIDSVDKLKEVLAYDDYRGKRGVFISLIHKFRVEELNDLQKELKQISQKKETIMTRRNVVAFVDEGHRSQYGILAAQMKSMLKSAFFFAFTGTPISKQGKDTYQEFAYPPAEPYLDPYTITDSLTDGFTVKIVYQPRLEWLHLKKNELETFLQTELEEIPDEVKEEVDEKTKKRFTAITAILENPKRIEEITEDIARHFKENLDGRFKAMVVAASRTACLNYKKAMDKFLPAEYSEIIMTLSTEEKKSCLAEYAKDVQEKHRGRDFDEVRKILIDKFKEDDLPKIFIVTDMLLTGFDAPILQVMYLDKLLKEHRLLQAIARTNRPYKDLKEAGIVIDYVGILKEFKRALEIYSTGDIKSALVDYESVRKEFLDLIDNINKLWPNLPHDYKRDTLLQAIEILTTEPKKEDEFVGHYRKLRKVFELLGPDEIKLHYFETYKWISAVYAYYMKVVNRRPSIDAYVEKYYEKTVKFVHNSTEVEKLEKNLPEIKFDDKYLKRLEELVKSRKEKAANILFTLQRFVLVDRYKNPIYETLSDRVERLMSLWREKTREYEAIYSEGVRIIGDINALSKRQKSLGFSNLEYALFLTLEQGLGQDETLPDKTRTLSQELARAMFPGWTSQITARKEIERQVRRFVRGFKNEYNLTLERIDKLYKELIADVTNYGA